MKKWHMDYAISSCYRKIFNVKSDENVWLCMDMWDLYIILFHRQKTVARKETKKKRKNIYDTVRISQHLADIRRHR